MSAPLATAGRADTLRVGIDGATWTNTRGYGRHTRSIVAALLGVDPETRYTLFVDSLAACDATSTPADVRRVRAAGSTRDLPPGAARTLRDVGAMSRALSDASFDVLLFPTVATYVPVLTRARKIVTFHDVIAERFPLMALGSRRAQLLWRIKGRLARWQADAILTPSEFARRGLIAEFGLPPDRVFALPSGAAPMFRPLSRPAATPALRALGLDGDERIILYVGGFSEHKRIDLLVDVFAELVARAPDIRLVLVGDFALDRFHLCYEGIRAQVRRLGLDDVVRFTGFLSDDDLVVLMNRATVLALPSMLEGFGLPALEAAACGCPVVATTASPIPELLGAAALPVRPGNRDDLGRALARVLDDAPLRAAMREKAPAAVAGYTWERTAERVAAVIHRVAGS